MRSRFVAVVLLVCLAPTGCAKSSPPESSTVKLTVLGVVRVADVFPEIGKQFTEDHPGVTFNMQFDTVDEVVRRIEEGEPVDVFAGSLAMYGDQLVDANKIGPYKVFATNPLVLITPKANPAGITTAEDLATKPVKLVIASDENTLTAPLTRMVLANLDATFGAGYSTAVMGKVVSREDMIGNVASKVESGEADAGLILISDVRDSGVDVNVIELPVEAKPYAAFPIAVVKTSKNAAIAQQFVDFVLTPPAQKLLEQAGLRPAPASSS